MPNRSSEEDHFGSRTVNWNSTYRSGAAKAATPTLVGKALRSWELLAQLRRTRGIRRSRHCTQKTEIHGQITDAVSNQRAAAGR